MSQHLTGSRVPAPRPFAVIVSIVAACALLSATAVASRAAGWRTVPIQTPAHFGTPALAANSLFGNLDCVSGSDCWTAGATTTSSGTSVAFIEHWDGRRFSVARTPSGLTYLQGIDCVTASDCWAAGASRSTHSGRRSPVMAHYDGARWSLSNVPRPAGTDDELSDVSCISRTSCYAVGWAADGSGQLATSSRTLIEHWTGRRWVIVSNAALPGQRLSYLDGIDCVARARCMVVGLEQAAKGDAPHVVGEHGMRANWSVVAMPSPAAPDDSTEIYGLVCPAANDCLATGASYAWPTGGLNPGTAMVEHWDGSHWSLVPVAGSAHANVMEDVACASTRSCWAVGGTFTDEQIAPAVIEHWNGSALSAVAAADPDPSDVLDAVACSGPSQCVAVGSGTTSHNHTQPIAEQLGSSSTADAMRRILRPAAVPALARVHVPGNACWGTCGGDLGPVGGSVLTSNGRVSFIADDLACLGSYIVPVLEGATRTRRVRLGQEIGTARRLRIAADGTFSFHGRVIVNLERWEGGRDGRTRTVGVRHDELTIRGRFTAPRTVTLTLTVANPSCRPVHLTLRDRAPAASTVAEPDTVTAQAQPAGNPAGIRLFAAESRALERTQTIRFTGSGGSVIDSQLGKVSFAHWSWTDPRPPAGYVPARVTGMIGVAHRRVAWTEVQLSPPVATTPGIAQQPVVVIGERAGTFYAFGTVTHHTCFGPAHGPYLSVGTPLLGSARTVLAPRIHGLKASLTFRFPWGRSRTGTETDTLARATDLPLRSITRISADHSDPAFSIRRTIRYGRPQAPPKVLRCG